LGDDTTHRDIEWLLSGSDGSVPIPVSEKIVIADQRWRGTVERLAVSDGLRVFLASAEIRGIVSLEPQHREVDAWLVSDIAVKGRVNLSLSDGSSVEVSRDQSVLFRPNDRTARFSPPPQPDLRVAGFMVRADRVQRMFGDEVPPVLLPIIAPDGKASPMLPLAADGELRRLAATLFSRKLTGVMRLVFLEGVVVQLLALQAAQSVRASATAPAVSLTPRRRRAIREARERLLADMASPPSLRDLAAAAGMSEKALNAGFRALYGTTVFGVLRDERLEHARLALQTTGASVKSIAFRVGYNHVSNFTKAFADRFGEPPRRYAARR
jgi:AraC-like DNA-binding protein